jgi:hypothetical protein
MNPQSDCTKLTKKQLERISPNIENGNFLSRNVIEEVLRESLAEHNGGQHCAQVDS